MLKKRSANTSNVKMPSHKYIRTSNSSALHTFVIFGLIMLFRGIVCRETVQFGHYLDVNLNGNIQIIGTVPEADLITCIDSCKHALTCKFVNFRDSAKWCVQLGFKTSPETNVIVVKKPGYVFGEKAKWDMNDIAVLSLTGCGPAPSVYMTESHGNMFGIGSKVKYICTNDETRTDQITCGNSAFWSMTDLMCITDCGPAPNVTNAYQVGTSTEVGSDIRYFCNIPYYRDQTITCQPNGTWTEIHLKCIPDVCLSPASVNIYGTSCYVYVAVKYRWETAKENCEYLGGYLAGISNEDEMENITTYIKTTNGYLNSDDSHRLYIGLNDRAEEGTFVWLNGEVAQYENFASGEPNGGNYEDCVMFTSWGRHWYDMACTRLLGSLCEFDL